MPGTGNNRITGYPIAMNEIYYRLILPVSGQLHDSGIKLLRVSHILVPYDGCLEVVKAACGLLNIESPCHGWIPVLEGQWFVTHHRFSLSQARELTA
jgi:hypothetical protein